MSTMDFRKLVVSLSIALILGLEAPVQANPQSSETLSQPKTENTLAHTTKMELPEDVIATTVSAGGNHTCALTTSGGVKCWGDNSFGQLGDGTTTKRLTAVDVVELGSGVIGISAGRDHTCALTTLGGVKCWGGNYEGQLGDGHVSESSLTPVDVSDLGSGVAAISNGDSHTCALMASGGVKCWGSNYWGQLGDGTTQGRSRPVDVSGLNSIIATIAAGGEHTCALTSEGGVKCWGYNNHGQLGDGTTIDKRLTPVNVFGLDSGMSDITAGYEHTCALTISGGAKCWGWDDFGQLGDGWMGWRITPVDVVGLTNGVSNIAGGWEHTCALMTSGEAKCWGANWYGNLGDGTQDRHFTPVDVVGLGGGGKVLKVGSFHTCILTTVGGIKCWGRNDLGQLGDGTTTNRFTPVDVVEFGGGGYTISGRVTTQDGNPLPGVEISATGNGTTTTATTDMNGNFTLSDLAEGTYTLIPYRDGYAFDRPSWNVPVMSNMSDIDFTAYILYITDIEINQGLGSVDLYVAGRHTAIYVFLSHYVHIDSAHQSLTVRRSKHSGNVAILNPQSDIPSTDVLIYSCPLPGCDNWQTGHYTFTVEVNGVTSSPKEVDFQERKSLKILAVPIRYIYGNINIPPPNDLHLGEIRDYLSNVLPIPSGGVTWTVAAELKFSPLFSIDLDFTKLQLIRRLRDQQPSECGAPPWNYDYCYDKIIGFIPPMPLDGIYGWSHPQDNIVSVAMVTHLNGNDSPTVANAAHEIGHTYGLGDEYWGGVLNCDQNPPPKGYKGCVGFLHLFCNSTCSESVSMSWSDGKSGTLITPEVDHPCDIIAECPIKRNLVGHMGNWSSLKDIWTTQQTYTYLFGKLSTAQQVLDSPDQDESAVLASGWISESDQVTLEPWRQITTSLQLSTTGEYSIEAIDELNQILASQRFDNSYVLLSYPPTESDIAPFNVITPFPTGTKSFRIKHNNSVLKELPVSPNPPQVTILSPNGGEQWETNGNYTVTWQGIDTDGDSLSYDVLYSPDNTNWMVLDAGITTTQITAHAGEIAGSSAARIRVVATDGVNTRKDESNGTFTVGRKPPEVFITSPEPNSTHPTGMQFYLRGYGYDLEDGQLGDQAFHWSSNRDGDLGTGSLLLVNLSPGEHTITLTATDSDGNSSTASVNIYVGHRVYLPMTTRQSQASAMTTEEIMPAPRAVATPIPYYAIAIMGVAATALFLKRRR